jgi:hypothetical protein
MDWDFQRRLHCLSFEETAAKYRKSLTVAVGKIDEDPERPLDPKTADALSKSLKSLEKTDTRGRHLGAVMPFIRIANRRLQEHRPEVKAQPDPYRDRIYRELVNYVTRKGLF